MNEQALGLHPLKSADRSALWVLTIIGTVVAIVNVVFSVMRITEILSGRSIQITADLTGFEPTLTGTDPADAFPISVDTITFEVDSLSSGAMAAALAQPILLILMTLGIITAFVVLARNILRGRVFTRGNTAALVAAWSFGIVGIVPQPGLQWAVASSALADKRIPEFGPDPTEMLSMQFSPFPFIALVIMIAITTHAFSVGTKIQRETEGLV